MSDSFILYTSDYQLIEGLTDAQLGQLTRALFIYTRDGEVVELEPVVRMAFGFIKDKIDRNQDKYQKKCERLRANAQKRWGMQKDANNADASNTIQKHTKAYKSMQLHAKGCLYDSDSVSDSDSDVSNETDKEDIEETSSSLSISAEPKVDAPQKPSKVSVQKIDYTAIKDYWNQRQAESHSAMRRLTLMSEQRQSNVRARLREVGGDASKIYRAIDIAMQSDFMNGKNGKGWVASFDWIMCPRNFPKVLEGNYTNEQPAAQQSQAEQDPTATARPSLGERYERAKHQQPAAQQSQDEKYAWIIQQNLEDLRKNPQNKPARQSLAKFYEQGVLQRLGIDWKP